jgi:hypothetical protein
MREPKRNVPPRWAALFSFYYRALPCQHGRRQAPGRLNYAASADSIGKLLVVGGKGLQTLARDSLHIVAFLSANTISRICRIDFWFIPEA